MVLWQKALGELPGPVVAYAFDRWEAEREHRPSPAHIGNVGRHRWQEQARTAQLAERKPERPFEPAAELTAAEKDQRAVVAEVLMNMFRSPDQNPNDRRSNHPEASND